MMHDDLHKLAGGFRFLEGPVWMEGSVVFSDIDGNTMYRWSAHEGVREYRKPSNHANGNTVARDGRLITCEHSTRRVTRDGKILVDSFKGKKFNSPNDVVEKSDGTIWFTDPPYGLPKDQSRELEKNFVFRFDPVSKKISVVIDDFDMPNGLCFSPDEKLLYIADSGKPHHVRVFDVAGDGAISNGRSFCVIDPGVPDGMRCDEVGRLWSTAGDGVHIFSPDGKLVEKILVPETPANLCFGEADRRTLFITARTSLYGAQIRI